MDIRRTMNARTIEPLGVEHIGEVSEVLSEAFADYPVMRWTLGDAPGYADRLPLLVRMFASGRALRGEPMLGLRGDDGTLLGVALVTPPVSLPPPAAFLALREATWAELGADAQTRYDVLVDTWRATAVDGAHHHLNMLGVRRAMRGRGLARHLLEAVLALADEDPASNGVDLTTEDAGNVALYERFGFHVTARAEVDAGSLTTWTLFRLRVRK